jgi:hypothetical protein
MLRVFLFLSLTIASGIKLASQSNVKIKSSPAINQLMEKYKSYCTAESNVKAWRIQIITTDDRREMELAQTTFKNMYPNINYDWRHVAPYYQVRVGYYDSKNKLMPFLLELKKTFPSATPVYDTMTKRSLVN